MHVLARVHWLCVQTFMVCGKYVRGVCVCGNVQTHLFLANHYVVWKDMGRA